MKTEPGTFSWSDLVARGKSEWDGVRNFEARNNMCAMKKGDLVFIYHSVDDREIVGVGRVLAQAHQDSTDLSGVWRCVDVEPVVPLPQPVHLDEIKRILACQNMVLLRRGRLSVQPVSADEWRAICDVAGLTDTGDSVTV